MTQDEFMQTAWQAGMRGTYKGKEYGIASIHFEEKLIAFDFYGDDTLTWVRCENVSDIK